MPSVITAFADEISPDLQTQIAVMKECGVHGLDLRTAFDKNVLHLTDDEVRTVRNACEEAGLSIHAIGSPVNKNELRDGGAEEELEKLKRIGEIAKLAGTRRIRIFQPRTEPPNTDAHWDEVKAWMRPQVDYAQANDLLLMSENDWEFFAAYPHNSRLLHGEFGGPNFRAIYDPGNAVSIGQRTMRDFFPWTTPLLDTIHVKDWSLAEKHFVFAGQGDGEFVPLFRHLREVGWSGPLTIEPHANVKTSAGGAQMSGVESFKEAVQCLRNVLSEAGFEL